MINIIEILERAAKNLSKKYHNSTNHKYDGNNYFDTHIRDVVYWGKRFLNILPGNVSKAAVIASLYLHDSIEDCRVTPNQLMKELYDEIRNVIGGDDGLEEYNNQVAQLMIAGGATSEDLSISTLVKYVAKTVYAVSNEKGWSRADRANDKYYSGIASYIGYIFVKLADRLANAEYSKKTGSTMSNTYLYEYTHFKDMLLTDESILFLARMWHELDKYLLSSESKSQLTRGKLVHLLNKGDNSLYVINDVKVMMTKKGDINTLGCNVNVCVEVKQIPAFDSSYSYVPAFTIDVCDVQLYE